MIQLSSKNDDSSLGYDVIITGHIFKIDKFVDLRRPKGASDVHKVSASSAAQASEARLYMYIHTLIDNKDIYVYIRYI